MSDLPKIGLDIGSSTIKIAELAPSGKKWKLLTMASMPSPKDWMKNSKANLTIVAQSIAKLCKEAGIHSRRVVVSLPEEQVSSHLVEMPMMSDDEVEQALQWQVEQYIPMPLDQAIWSYQIVKRDEVGKSGLEVLLAATPKTVVEFYTQVAQAAELEVIAVETELMATARAIVPPTSPLALIADIGSRGTDIGLVQNNTLLFSRTIPTAGEAFTRAIATTLGLEDAQAEEYKNTYGFSKEQLEGKLTEAMQPVLKSITDEIKKTIDFYTSKHSGESVKYVVLSGGVAALPNIVNQLSVQLGLEVTVGDPFSRVEIDQSQKEAIGNTAPFYTVSVGLAMREL